MKTITPTKGSLLIAEPFLKDPNFERSVILLCEHNEEIGSFGFVLNQQINNLSLSDVVEDVHTDFPIYLGGPVEHNTLHFVHRLGEKITGAVSIGNGLYWSGSFDDVRLLLQIGKLSEKDIRMFVGYAGWGAGQLNHEVEKKSWIISDPASEFIFETPTEQFWRSTLKRMGGEYRILSNYPSDPRLN